MDRTLVLLKPDGVRRNLLGEVATSFQRAGLRLHAIRMLQLIPARAGEFYAVHRGKPFYERLLAFMTSGPLVAMAWAGGDAVARARAVMGATDWRQALPGTIRAEHARHITFNVVHGSDSPENAVAELAFFFAPDEMFATREQAGPET